MAISYDDLKLLIVSKVKSCPPQIVTQRLQWAARLFIDKSEIWRYDQNQDMVANQNPYLLAVPSTATNAQIKRLSGVWYGSESAKKKRSSLTPTDEYQYKTNILGATVADTAVPSTPDPDVRGDYFANGNMYNSQAVYKIGNDAYFLWYDGSQWNISDEVGDTAESFIGAGGTIAGDYSAVGTATGSVTLTDNSGEAVNFIEAYTAALEFGLTTEIVMVPALDSMDEVPDLIMNEWGVRGIMECALWDLKGDKDQPWEDEDGAKEHYKNYIKELDQAIRSNFVNRTAGDMRVIPR